MKGCLYLYHIPLDQRKHYSPVKARQRCRLAIKADTCGGVIRKFHEECGIGQSAHSTRGNVESMLQDAAIPKLDANLFTHIARHDVATFKKYYYRPAPDSFLARLAKLEDSLINNCNLWTIIRL